MILDKENVFGGGSAITLGSGAVTSAIDLGAAGDAIGQELTLHNVVTVAFAGGTSCTPSLETSADGSAYHAVLTGPTVVTSDGKAGKDIFCVRAPQGLQRYVRMNFTVSGTMSAGKVMTFLSKDL